VEKYKEVFVDEKEGWKEGVEPRDVGTSKKETTVGEVVEFREMEAEERDIGRGKAVESKGEVGVMGEGWVKEKLEGESGCCASEVDYR
jgi:hypothetical protein